MKALCANNKKLTGFILLVLCLACIPAEKGNSSENISFDLWYGSEQEFGRNGLAQKWINILGNIQSKRGIKETYYRLNNSEKRIFSLGSDLHRLAATGDFNIDLSVVACKEGTNSLKFFIKDSLGNTSSDSINFLVHKSNKWPLPYSVDWKKVKDINKVVQVVDGNWKITENGVQNIDMYYDRVLAFGDSTWTNYEVSTTVVFHDFTPPTKGPPTYDVSHAAIASRWPGHDQDSLQPHRKWYPLGATSEFRLTTALDSCRWRIFDGPKPEGDDFYQEEDKNNYRNISLNKVYGIKHRVETIKPLITRYSVKLWPIDTEEPLKWDFVAEENNENIHNGGALLIAHNTSVTFGNIYATPLKKEYEIK